MKILFILLLSLFALSLSCKKKNIECDQTNESFTNDTIYPSEYLMTYPGSWWEYHQGSKDSCTNWEDVMSTEVETKENCITTTTDHHFLPRSTRYGLVANNKQVISNNGAVCTQFQNIIGGNLGDVIFSSVNYSNSTGGGSYNKHETTNYYHEHLNNLTIQNQVFNDVVVIKSEYILYPSQGPQHLQSQYFFYYAKDVGLIKQLLVVPTFGNYDSLELVNHYIAPH